MINTLAYLNKASGFIALALLSLQGHQKIKKDIHAKEKNIS
jgi:hypothetical protein